MDFSCIIICYLNWLQYQISVERDICWVKQLIKMIMKGTVCKFQFNWLKWHSITLSCNISVKNWVMILIKYFGFEFQRKAVLLKRHLMNEIQFNASLQYIVNLNLKHIFCIQPYLYLHCKFFSNFSLSLRKRLQHHCAFLQKFLNEWLFKILQGRKI